MKRLITISMAVLLGGQLWAQNDVQLSQFMANKLYFNPAATGSSDYFNAAATYRTQWLGSNTMAKKDRPNYMLFNATQFFWDQRSGVGLTVYDGRSGVLNNFQAKLSYAYHLQVQEEAFLSMGASVGMLSSSVKGAQTPEGNPVDYRNAMSSDLGFGLEYYTPELYVGVSVAHIPVVIGDQENKQHTHFYYYMSYFYNINKDWKLIPSLILRNSSFITNFDVNARISYQNKFLVGASYRMDAFALMAGINIADMFSIGYSIDFSMGMGRTNGLKPSHEITLSYRGMLLKKQSKFDRVESPKDF